MLLRRVLVAVVPATTAIAAAFAAPSAGAAPEQHEVTRSAGTVSATLSWRGDFAETRNFRVEISRAGAQVVNEAVTVEDCGDGGVRGFACPWPVGENPLAVRDLDGDGEPEVLITAFTGGAHCCVIALIYRWNGSEYVTLERNFASAGWRLIDYDNDGTVEFRTSDSRFDFLYGSHAESVFPIQIVAFDGGQFSDVTTAFPKAIRKDARTLRRIYEDRADSRKRLGVRAALAGYVADRYLLDRKSGAERVLKRALADGVLERNRFDPVGPWGRKFIRDLKRVLRQFGY